MYNTCTIFLKNIYDLQRIDYIVNIKNDKQSGCFILSTMVDSLLFEFVRIYRTIFAIKEIALSHYAVYTIRNKTVELRDRAMRYMAGTM